MRIADILARKGRQVHTVEHGQPVRDATRLMHRERIGAVVVVNPKTGAPSGIVSQSEIVAALFDFDDATAAHCVTGVMRKPAPHCTPDTKVSAAMAQMTRDRARHLVVVDAAGTVAGIVSMGDLVAARLGEAELEANTLRDMARSTRLVDGADAGAAPVRF